jgi:hypothetical protein
MYDDFSIINLLHNSMFYFDLPFNSPPKEREMDELCKRSNDYNQEAMTADSKLKTFSLNSTVKK